MGVERKRLRCALYARVLSEERLEQAFNSLAAQREACEAFVLSQRHEGWRVLQAPYDDGGYSGGTLERPALKRLLADIAAGKLDCVVVYKVDRLTRALSDFAKIVEVFDARGIALVSVTQQFNSATSMGRLSLNVLLSFAQFERELTAERVRDKFAASKRKGLWMGGRVPLGYDLNARQLVINTDQAALVRSVYQRYLELGCVTKLRAALIIQGIVSKRRVSGRGRVSGGVAYSRGALYALLKNRVYLGEIAYRGEIYRGNHEAIVDRALWQQVQQHLGAKRTARRDGAPGRTPSLLLGLLYDDAGQRYTPSHTIHNGKCYRYYVAQRAEHLQGARGLRIPAQDLEALVVKRLLQLLGDQLALLDALSAPGDDAALLQVLLAAARARCQAWRKLAPEQVRLFVRAVIVRISVAQNSIVIALNKFALRSLLLPAVTPSAIATAQADEDDLIELSVEARVRRRGRSVRLVVSPLEANTTPVPENRVLIEQLAQGHHWLEQWLRGEVSSLRAIAKASGRSERHVSQVLRAAFLAPDLVEALLHGRQASQATLRQVMKHLPWDWREQRRQLGLPPDINDGLSVRDSVESTP